MKAEQTRNAVTDSINRLLSHIEKCEGVVGQKYPKIDFSNLKHEAQRVVNEVNNQKGRKLPQQLDLFCSEDI